MIRGAAVALLAEASCLAWETVGEGVRGSLAALVGMSAAHVLTGFLLRGEVAA